MKISKNPNLTATPTLDGCKFWKSRKKPNLTPIQFRCVSKLLNCINKFGRKHFTSRSSDTSSTNPNMMIIDSLPSLPFDLITEILSRLPVKFLLQLRCVCKSWNSLISNHPNFAKKHLTHSTTYSICSLGFTYPGTLTIFPPNFFFDTTVSTNVNTLPYDSYNSYRGREIVGSCNGILCLAYMEFILLWNPSIRKIQELPLLPNPHYPIEMYISYAFGYHSVTDTYKVVVVSRNKSVKVNTLGTKIWKNIDHFPFATLPDHKSGIYVSGTINWLVSPDPSTPPHFFVSLDLGNESYQKLLLPDYGEVDADFFSTLALGVFRDCLCTISRHEHCVWLMKEYGKKESWTKLFTISFKQRPCMQYSLNKVVYVFEDGQVLLQCKMPYVPTKLILYDPRIATFEFVSFENSLVDNLDVSKYGGPEVCIESLISPCS
ncbi:hypothetical protein RYX36_012120 [Vicia faba]